MITVDFSKNKDIGLCEQLYNTIKTQIMNTTLKPDSKLPSKRALASHLGISVITVQNAYAQLISEGYIYSIEKKGFYVTDFSDFNIKPHNYNSAQGVKPQATQTTQSAQAPEFFTDFRSNSTNAQKFPFTLWSHTARQVLNSQDEKLLIRSDMKGTYELRFAIAEYLLEFRNMQVLPQQIVIGAGTEALYSMLV